MIVLNKYSDIYKVANNTREFIINVSKLSIKQRLRVIDFLCGLSFINGSLKKLDVNTYKCIY